MTLPYIRWFWSYMLRSWANNGHDEGVRTSMEYELAVRAAVRQSRVATDLTNQAVEKGDVAVAREKDRAARIASMARVAAGVGKDSG